MSAEPKRGFLVRISPPNHARAWLVANTVFEPSSVGSDLVRFSGDYRRCHILLGFPRGVRWVRIWFGYPQAKLASGSVFFSTLRGRKNRTSPPGRTSFQNSPRRPSAPNAKSAASDASRKSPPRRRIYEKDTTPRFSASSRRLSLYGKPALSPVPKQRPLGPARSRFRS